MTGRVRVSLRGSNVLLCCFPFQITDTRVLGRQSEPRVFVSRVVEAEETFRAVNEGPIYALETCPVSIRSVDTPTVGKTRRKESKGTARAHGHSQSSKRENLTSQHSAHLHLVGYWGKEGIARDDERVVAASTTDERMFVFAPTRRVRQYIATVRRSKAIKTNCGGTIYGWGRGEVCEVVVGRLRKIMGNRL